MAHEIPKISVEDRQRLGSRYAQRVRATGKIPAVIYGHGQDPAHVVVDRKQITELIEDNAHLLEVTAPAGVQPCLIKDVQWDHLGSTIVHVDLARVDLSETVEVEVALEVKGDAIGLKQEGAYLDHPVTQLSVECRADSIPEEIVIDVSNLEVDQAITVADLKLPDGVTCTMDPETVLAQVLIAEEETAATEPAADTAEPELIRKRPEDGEEAAAE